MWKLDPAVLSLAPWSPSMADLALECPHAFHRKYIAKEAEVEAKGDAASIGTLVHRIFEWTLRTNQPMGLDAAFKHAFETLEPPYEVYLQARTYRDAIKDFLVGIERYKEKFKVAQSFTEYKLALTPEFTRGEYSGKESRRPLVRGIADYLVITESGSVAIFDHKTGAVKPISMYGSQELVYNVCIDAMLPGVKYTRLGIHYVGADPNTGGGRTVWAPEYPVEAVRTHLRQKLVDYLNRAAQAAQGDEPHKSWRCNYCGYRSVCPLHQQQAQAGGG